MSLNPIQTGKQVIDQFGRYLLSTFPIAHPDLHRQFRQILQHGLGGERFLSKGPYVYLNRPFEQGPTIQQLIDEPGLKLHPVLKGIFRFDSLHKHQELAIRAIKAGQHTVLSTGTGSGKTEAFLLPIFDLCLRLRDEKAPPGLVAIIVYPQNALVNDQLKRLREMLAGTGIRFARYTGETPDGRGDNMPQMENSRAYTREELRRVNEDENFALIPWEECYSRADIQDSSKTPRILLTNYSQLEYLMLRDKDLNLFRNTPLKYLVMDEVHTYTGELGSEVACLIRRVRAVAKKKPEELICVGTSATIGDNRGKADPETLTREFAHRLFGVDKNNITIIREVYKKPDPPAQNSYVPSFPEHPDELLNKLLDAARDTQLQESPEEIPDHLLAVAEELCGRKASAGVSNSDRLFDLLTSNRLVYQLKNIFTEPNQIDDVLPRLTSIGDRKNRNTTDIVSEVLCYLTLGALAQRDGEPVLLPKLHYFVRGLQGIWAVLDPAGLRLFASHTEAQKSSDYKALPMILCKSCGQHYFKLFLESDIAAGDSLFAASGYRKGRVPADKRDDVQAGETTVYVTDALVTVEDEDVKLASGYLCRFCGTLHDSQPTQCQDDKCRHRGADTFLKVSYFHKDEESRCPSCGSPQSHMISTHSSEVFDVHILAQSLLGAMQEPELQKLIVFADSRQDTAFQAAWMEERSKRFRLRHILYSILHHEPSRIWGLNSLAGEILERAIDLGLFKRQPFGQDEDEMRIKWFLLEEIGTIQQRRIGVENLGLAKVVYHKLDVQTDPEFFTHWGTILDISPADVLKTVRLILDYYRRVGTISDPLFQRSWSYQDPEYRKGIIQTPDHWYPLVLILESLPSNHQSKRYTKGLIASNGRSGAQLVVASAVSEQRVASASFSADRDRFLEALWEWLHGNDLLVGARLVRRIHGHIEQINIPVSAAQINCENVGVTETATRYLCGSCRKAHAEALPTLKCTEYHCNGTVQQTGRDLENYDVVQYTKLAFVPLKSREHSAQLQAEQRQEAEREFKKTIGKFNCIVCTPTLELGVDIGRLEMVLMKNVAPTPANYAQRAGRAGRRHRIATVFTYCREVGHDQYFFEEPRDIIAGAVKVPAFSLQNRPLIRKHIHSTVLTSLREFASASDKETLARAFPSYVYAYLGEKTTNVDPDDVERLEFFERPCQFPELQSLITRHKSGISNMLKAVFQATWSKEDRDAVDDDLLTQSVESYSATLQLHSSRLFERIRAFRDRIRTLNRKSDQFTLTRDEEKELRVLSNAVRRFTQESRDNYSLTYLTQDGFFPGYALTREGVLAQCIDPFLEIRRPVTVAIRELTPANHVYADRKVFRTSKINYRQMRSDGRGENRDSYLVTLCYDPALDKVSSGLGNETEGGETRPVQIESALLVETELYELEKIDDRKMTRRRIGFNLYGVAVTDHHGGEEGQVGDKTYRYLVNQQLMLVNIGPSKLVAAGLDKIGYPMCPACGAVRDPFQTAEIEKFREKHRQSCNVHDIKRVALHVTFRSDTLQIGPYGSSDEAINVLEGIRIGASEVLDMGEVEIEGFVVNDTTQRHWIVFYDPVPGGSGFIPQIMKYWQPIVESGVSRLSECAHKCEEACYSCMLHFRNQQHHKQLNRFKAELWLQELLGSLNRTIVIPPSYLSSDIEEGESGAEDKCIRILRERKFPLPENQHRVDLGDGSFTVADYAYVSQRVLIYVDGMGESLHGNPEQQRRDRVTRAKLRMMGYKVIEITAVSLNDSSAIDACLEELAVYLG